MWGNNKWPKMKPKTEENIITRICASQAVFYSRLHKERKRKKVMTTC